MNGCITSIIVGFLRLIFGLPATEEPPVQTSGTATAGPTPPVSTYILDPDAPTPHELPNNVTAECWLCGAEVATAVDDEAPVLCIACEDKRHPNPPRG